MTASRNAYKKRRRLALFKEQGGCCYWCKCEMVLPPATALPRGQKLPANTLTLDHLRDRFHPGRQQPARGDKRYVAACWQCNAERGQVAQRAQPAEELRRRSQQHPQHQEAAE